MEEKKKETEWYSITDLADIIAVLNHLCWQEVRTHTHTHTHMLQIPTSSPNTGATVPHVTRGVLRGRREGRGEGGARGIACEDLMERFNLKLVTSVARNQQFSAVPSLHALHVERSETCFFLPWSVLSFSY